MAASGVRTLSLPLGESIPVLGQGTWHLAEDPERWEVEVASLRLGLDLRLTLIDTAEMYADGATEELVGEAIDGRRDEVFRVSKVLQSHATRREAILACERSLPRLRTDWIDLYLLHWRGFTLLEETVDAFAELIDAGKIVDHRSQQRAARAAAEPLCDDAPAVYPVPLPLHAEAVVRVPGTRAGGLLRRVRHARRADGDLALAQTRKLSADPGPPLRPSGSSTTRSRRSARCRRSSGASRKPPPR